MLKRIVATYLASGVFDQFVEVFGCQGVKNIDWWPGCDIACKGAPLHVGTLHDFLDEVCHVLRVQSAPLMRMPIFGIYKIKRVGNELFGRVEQVIVEPGKELCSCPRTLLPILALAESSLWRCVKVGWKQDMAEKHIPFLPLSVWMGDKLLRCEDAKGVKNMGWWSGCGIDCNGVQLHVGSVYGFLDKVCRVPGCPVSATMRMPISGIYNIKGVVDAKGVKNMGWCLGATLAAIVHNCTLAPCRTSLARSAVCGASSQRPYAHANLSNLQDQACWCGAGWKKDVV